MKTYRWKKLRQRIINRDYFCQRCFYKYQIINTNELTVHHILSRHNHIELMFDEDNLMCLCATCNKQLGTKDKLDFEYEKPNEYIPIL
ncbi:HNH endonuclease [Bacillus mycoides]|uniref:HNH endonuclease n=1 Tax=Bacillus mycoides TaxID=1405 RepID=UPI00389A97BA